jgi:hypothetical protein
MPYWDDSFGRFGAFDSIPTTVASRPKTVIGDEKQPLRRVADRCFLSIICLSTQSKKLPLGLLLLGCSKFLNF